MPPHVAYYFKKLIHKPCKSYWRGPSTQQRTTPLLSSLMQILLVSIKGGQTGFPPKYLNKPRLCPPFCRVELCLFHLIACGLDLPYCGPHLHKETSRGLGNPHRSSCKSSPHCDTAGNVSGMHSGRQRIQMCLVCNIIRNSGSLL